MRKKVLITLATGKTGFLTAKQLLQEGFQVRIYVRSRNEKALALEKLGAELAIGEFNDYHRLKKALEGIDNVYYCYPYKSGMSDDIKLFIQAAKEEKINAVIFMGQRIAEFSDTGSSLTNDVRITYELLEKSGLEVVYFVPGYFADNVFVVTEFVLQLGIFPNTFGNGKNPWISIGDMSRCIAALLKEPEPYFGQRLYPTGDKSISAREIVHIFSEVRGRKVRLVNIPDWLFIKSGLMIGKEYGFDTYAVVQATFYNKQMQMNRFDIQPTDIVKKLTGREPENFETITTEYFSNSKYKKRNVINWFSAFKRFNIMPFTKVPGKRELATINK